MFGIADYNQRRAPIRMLGRGTSSRRGSIATAEKDAAPEQYEVANSPVVKHILPDSLAETKTKLYFFWAMASHGFS